MSKDVKFNIKLTIDGKEHIVEASTNVKKFVTRGCQFLQNAGEREENKYVFRGKACLFITFSLPLQWQISQRVL